MLWRLKVKMVNLKTNFFSSNSNIYLDGKIKFWAYITLPNFKTDHSVLISIYFSRKFPPTLLQEALNHFLRVNFHCCHIQIFCLWLKPQYAGNCGHFWEFWPKCAEIWDHIGGSKPGLQIPINPWKALPEMGRTLLGKSNCQYLHTRKSSQLALSDSFVTG